MILQKYIKPSFLKLSTPIFSIFPRYNFSELSQAEKDEREEKRRKASQFDDTSIMMMDKFKRMKQRFSVTKDEYRVDLGLIIDRPPIFFNLSDKEFEYMKYRSQLDKKLKTGIEVPKELLTFELNFQADALINKNIENFKTHQDPETGNYYCGHSKYYKNVDPNLDDPKSIQNAPNYKVYFLVKNKENGEWEFPTCPLLENQKFEEAKNSFFELISEGKWKIAHYTEVPYLYQERKFFEKEMLDKRNKKLKGAKTFFFGATHSEGIIEVKNEEWSDYVWVPKLQMNKYLTRDYYNTVIHSLFLY